MNHKHCYKVILRGSFQFIAVAIFLFFTLIIGREVASYRVPTRTYFPVDIRDRHPKHYYENLSTKYTAYTQYGGVFDKNGVPLYLNHIDKKCYYHPVYIAQFALGAYEVYINTGDIMAKEAFLKCAYWLVGSLQRFNDFHYWLNNMKIDAPDGLYATPFPSAMDQGQGVSVLVRAYCETKNEKFLQASELALEPVLQDISKGGCSVVIGKNYIFPQEYITKQKPSNILNGAITCFFGLYDFCRVTKSYRHEQYCKIILDSFAVKLPLYDAGFWSLYDLYPNPSNFLGGNLASHHYHSEHILQLRVLHLISGRPEFLQYSDKWKGYQENWICRIKVVLLTHWYQLRRAEIGDFSKIPSFTRSLVRELI